jgi:hypothetical protein
VTAVAELEVTAVHAPGTDLAAYQPQAVEEYRPRIIMEPAEAADLDNQLRSMMKAILREGTDYGTIPGTPKPSLWKPGAEKLLQWFGFGHEIVKADTERNEDGSRLGVTYRCTVTKEMQDGRKVTVATCEGYAGYDEDSFFITEQDARRKAEASERKWARKDNRAPKPEKWENAAEYRAPWNSVIKMAQKRSLVGAALQATSASTLFTQDLEDMRAGQGADPFMTAADAAMMALPQDVRDAIDGWWRARKWPPPDRWTPEQMVSALQTAGYLTARRESAQRPATGPQPAAAGGQAAGEAEDAPVVVTPDPMDGEAGWVRGFVARIGTADETKIRTMRVELGKAVQAKVLDHKTANELTDLLQERAAAIRGQS